ncbi:uncharacterized protein B0P05DRAFT_545559 [Gilbertella persicaria]|uniref:uncharacterized protein n=1 Tax=Gilbertella persicaria TaxID=101096 RepID=UPI00222029E3|nr:uncharacterized protein B0P05DRAFT_545559 [Gilbertella persicaria]KAI8076712.1 hypothetical protein B0P05DRAFT_545559 [Gilbertella persicaria]
MLLTRTKVLEQSILAEANLNQLVQTHRKDSRKIFANDSPNSITLSTRIDTGLFKPVQQQLAVALGDKDSSSETQQFKQMTRVILARSYFESGEYQKTFDTIEDADYRALETPGYSFALYIQALAIRAMSLDLMERKEESLEAYNQVASLVSQCENITDRSIVDWAEESLYRGTLVALSYQSEDVPKTMGLVRAYQKATSSQPAAWRVYKRLTITIHSLNYLSEKYRAEQYRPPIDFAQTEEGKQINEKDFDDANRMHIHQLFSIEVIQLHTVYEKLVYTIVQFPRSGESSSLVVRFVNKLAEDFALVGGSETEKRGYLEALNRASLKTFNSPCITRHLFHALISLGDYEEAEHALRTYLYLIGLESKALLEERSSTAALASDSFGYSTPVPTANREEEFKLVEHALKADGPERSKEVETVKDQISVIAAAVKMYCQELSKGAEAVYVAELAELVYKHVFDDSQKILGAQVYRILGIALGFLATQTFDQDSRPKYHKRALNALKQSLELDPLCWETYYQIALQLAEMRDIIQAIQMITQSIQYNPQHLPSWHLLALLCTCPIKNSQAQALKTCEMGLLQASELPEDGWVDYGDDIEQQIKLQMTQTLLIERIHGAEAALTSQEGLFQTFGKIVVPELIPDSSNMLHEAISNGNTRYGMVLSGSLGNMSEQGSEQKTTRGRSASSASRTSTIMTKNGRTRSVSSFTGRKLHLAELFNDKSDVGSIRSVPMPGIKHTSRLSLLDPKNLIRKQKKDEDPLTGDTRGTITNNDSISSIHSITPSVLSANTLLQNTTTLTRPTTCARLQHQRSCHLLCDLWLLSAEAFLKTGKIDEALKAVSEAENVDWTTHAGVWCLLGRIYLAQNQSDRATKAFQKGLVTKPNDVNCRVWLAKTFMDRGDIEVAEGLLEAVTKENGWNCPAAWFYLGEVYKNTDRVYKAKDCLFYALELESTTPIQPFDILPKFV